MTEASRIFAPLLVCAGETRLDCKSEVLLLQIHTITAEHSAERNWLAISSDPRFVSGSMTEDEVNGRLSRAVTNVIEVVAEFHVRHGIVDPAFNELAARHVIDAFYRRCEKVASHIEDRGRA